MEPSHRGLTRTLPADDSNALREALAGLQQGEVIAFPTDTVYGVGTAVDNVAAVERLYEIKGRPHDAALPLLLAEAGDVERVCHDVPAAAWKLARRFWPGGLTLVLLRKPIVPDRVTGGRPSVAVRLPDHSVPRELARRLGMPLASSSANRSGEPSPVTAAEVLAQLGGRIPLLLDGGPCRQARPSTIVDLTTDPPVVLREGPVTRDEIEAALGEEAR
jgi:L-threonylcarbamoyladenylate synthase